MLSKSLTLEEFSAAIARSKMPMDGQPLSIQSPLMAVRGRYLFGQKISDAQIERVLHHYVNWVAAADLIREAKEQRKRLPSSKTIYQIYALTRRRLRELRIYTEPELHQEMHAEGISKEFYEASGKPERLAQLMNSYKGIWPPIEPIFWPRRSFASIVPQ